jgi:putative heme iron utilization protein
MTESITPEISDRICQHMNEDHADAVLLYAQVFGNAANVTQAQMLSIDSSGMDLNVHPAKDDQPLRVTFDHPLKDAEDAHQTLIAMVKQARLSLKQS